MIQDFVMSQPKNANGTLRIGAHVAVRRMVALKNWFCLGPVAAWPEWQNGALARSVETRPAFRFGSRLVGMIAVDFAEGGE